MRSIIVVWLCFFFLIFKGEALFAATIFVSTTGTDNLTCGSIGSPCNTINYTVNNIANANDSIYIYAGIHAGKVIIPEGESFIFVGDTTGGAIIDGGSLDRGFLYDYVTCGKSNDGNAANLDFMFFNLTMRNCYYLGSTCNSTTIAYGSAIFLINDNDGGTTMDVTIDNCVFEDNMIEDHGPNNNGRKSNGGAVALHGLNMGSTNFLIENSQFYNNQARQDANGGHGGAIWIAEFPNGGIINNCVFEGNQAYGVNSDCGDQGLTRNGGGAIMVYAVNNANYTIDNCSFISNDASICATCCTTNPSNGGAILLMGSGTVPVLQIRNSFFCSNTVEGTIADHHDNISGTMTLSNNEYDKLTSDVLGADTTVCMLDSFLLESKVQSKLSLIYSWNDGSSDSTLMVDTSGDYTLEVSYGACIQKDTITVSVMEAGIDISADTIICESGPVQLSATGAASYIWTPGVSLDDSLISNPIATPLITTTYFVRSNDDSLCFDEDTVTITIADVITSTSPSATICSGDEINLFASGGDTYLWEADSTLSDVNISNPTVSPETSTTYKLAITDSLGCVHQHSITIDLYAMDSLIITNDTTVDVPATELVLETMPHDSISWSPFTDIDCQHCPNPIATVNGDITYFATAIDSNGCVVLDSINIYLSEDSCNISSAFIPNSFTPNGDGINDYFEIFGLTGQEELSLSIFDRWGDEVFQTNNHVNKWDGNVKSKNASPGVYVYYLLLSCKDGSELEFKGNITLLK